MTTQTDLNDQNLDAAIAAHRQGRLDEAEPVYRAFTEAQPDRAEPWHLLGVIALQRGQPANAEPYFRKALEHEPDHVKCRTNLGGALFQLGCYEDAERELKTALRAAPDHIDALFNLGNALIAQHRDADAAKALLRVLDLKPDHAKALTNLGILQNRHFANAEALASLERALALAPGDFTVLVNLAQVCERLNDLDRARTLIAEALSIDPTSPIANMSAAQMDLRTHDPKAACEKIERALNDLEEPESFPRLHYMRAQALDALNDADGAMAACQNANAYAGAVVKRRGTDKERYLNLVELAHNRLGAGPVTPGGGDRSSHSGPVFFVGFPRSGTTLFEQMLRAHPQTLTTNETSPLLPALDGLDQAFSANSLNTERQHAIQTTFWREAETLVGSLTGRTLIDTAPLNIRVLDYAARVFPESKVVMIVRDPRDVCLSAFMQNFNPDHDMLANFLNLDDTVHLYQRIMGLWLKQDGLLDQDRLIIRYEDVIADMEGCVKSVLDFIGLPWSDAVRNYRDQARAGHVNTPSYTQVGEKLHTRSQNRWLRYAAYLAPHQDTLAPYVRAFGYEDSPP